MVTASARQNHPHKDPADTRTPRTAGESLSDEEKGLGVTKGSIC